MKLGQILATKTDMLPAAYTSSLARLCDRLPPMPFDKVGLWGDAAVAVAGAVSICGCVWVRGRLMWGVLHAA